jgi:hypothetical protein
MDNSYNFKDRRVARILSVLENDPVAVIRNEYAAKMGGARRATAIINYDSAFIFISNFLYLNQYRNYNLKLINQLLNYYIIKSKKITNDIASAKGGTNAIQKVYLGINKEILHR